jgi:hypothetical protein
MLAAPVIARQRRAGNKTLCCAAVPCEIYVLLCTELHTRETARFTAHSTAVRPGRIARCQVAHCVFTLRALYGTSMLYVCLNPQGTPCTIDLLIKNVGGTR